jgi:hypothetical protein
VCQLQPQQLSFRADSDLSAVFNSGLFPKRVTDPHYSFASASGLSDGQTDSSVESLLRILRTSTAKKYLYANVFFMLLSFGWFVGSVGYAFAWLTDRPYFETLATNLHDSFLVHTSWGQFSYTANSLIHCSEFASLNCSLAVSLFGVESGNQFCHQLRLRTAAMLEDTRELDAVMTDLWRSLATYQDESDLPRDFVLDWSNSTLRLFTRIQSVIDGVSLFHVSDFEVPEICHSVIADHFASQGVLFTNLSLSLANQFLVVKTGYDRRIAVGEELFDSRNALYSAILWGLAAFSLVRAFVIEFLPAKELYSIIVNRFQVENHPMDETVLPSDVCEQFHLRNVHCRYAIFMFCFFACYIAITAVVSRVIADKFGQFNALCRVLSTLGRLDLLSDLGIAELIADWQYSAHTLETGFSEDVALYDYRHSLLGALSQSKMANENLTRELPLFFFKLFAIEVGPDFSLNSPDMFTLLHLSLFELADAFGDLAASLIARADVVVDDLELAYVCVVAIAFFSGFILVASDWFVIHKIVESFAHLNLIVANLQPVFIARHKGLMDYCRGTSENQSGAARASNFWEVYESIQLPLLILNEKGFIVGFTQSLTKQFHYRREQLIGQKFAVLLGGDGMARESNDFRSVLRMTLKGQMQNHGPYTVPCRTATNEIVHVLAWVTRFDVEGEVFLLLEIRNEEEMAICEESLQAHQDKLSQLWFGRFPADLLERPFELNDDQVRGFPGYAMVGIFGDSSSRASHIKDQVEGDLSHLAPLVQYLSGAHGAIVLHQSYLASLVIFVNRGNFPEHALEYFAVAHPQDCAFSAFLVCGERVDVVANAWPDVGIEKLSAREAGAEVPSVAIEAVCDLMPALPELMGLLRKGVILVDKTFQPYLEMPVTDTLKLSNGLTLFRCRCDTDL